MTMTPDHVNDATTTGAAGRRGPGRKAAQFLALSVATALAITFAVLWGLGAQELRDERARAVDLSGQVAGLEDSVTDAQNLQSSLQEQLTEAQGQAEAGLVASKAEKNRLEAREEALVKRAQVLDDREADVAARETDVAAREEALAAVDEGASSADPGGSLPEAGDFDRAWLLSKAQDAIEDIESIDVRMKDGIGVSTALWMLSDSFGRMAEAGVPPGVDPSAYMAGLQTLADFAAGASDLYDADPMEATAKYAVLRKETGILFNQINNALGTDLQLP